MDNINDNKKLSNFYICITGEYKKDLMQLRLFDIRMDGIKRGVEEITNEELLLLLNNIIDFFNEFIPCYQDYCDATGYEFLLFRREKYEDYRDAIQSICDNIDENLNLIRDLNILKFKK